MENLFCQQIWAPRERSWQKKKTRRLHQRNKLNEIHCGALYQSTSYHTTYGAKSGGFTPNIRARPPCGVGHTTTTACSLVHRSPSPLFLSYLTDWCLGSPRRTYTPVLCHTGFLCKGFGTGVPPFPPLTVGEIIYSFPGHPVSFFKTRAFKRKHN